jgi:hercynylcysteine S-oxide lyase
MTTPVLRASPHVDVTAEELEQFAEVLAGATDAG